MPFSTCRGGGLQHPVFYHMHEGHDQLVLPSGSKLYKIVLQELYDKAQRGNPCFSKMLEALKAYVRV